MKKSVIILTVVTTLLLSCGQENKSTRDIGTKDIEVPRTTENVESNKNVANANNKYIDTRYEYADSTGKHLIIENSLPKGGMRYTAPNGEEYVYAIFWTRIINETANAFELSIELSTDSYTVPSSPGNYFKIFLPSEKMTIEKAPLFNYGLTGLDAIINNELHNASSFQRTVKSSETSLFYVVTLFKQGVEGSVRSGLSLKGDKLYYSVNDREFYCGQINFKNLGK